MKLTDKQRIYIMSMMSQLNIDDDMRADITFNFTNRTSHVSELTIDEAKALIEALQKEVDKNPERKEQNIWRKRLIAAVSDYLRMKGYAYNYQAVEATICRAGQTTNINKLTVDRLRSLYSAFCKQNKDMASAQALTINIEKQQAILN